MGATFSLVRGLSDKVTEQCGSSTVAATPTKPSLNTKALETLKYNDVNDEQGSSLEPCRDSNPTLPDVVQQTPFSRRRSFCSDSDSVSTTEYESCPEVVTPSDDFHSAPGHTPECPDKTLLQKTTDLPLDPVPVTEAVKDEIKADECSDQQVPQTVVPKTPENPSTENLPEFSNPRQRSESGETESSLEGTRQRAESPSDSGIELPEAEGFTPVKSCGNSVSRALSRDSLFLNLEDEGFSFERLEADTSIVVAELQNKSLDLESEESTPDSTEILNLEGLRASPTSLLYQGIEEEKKKGEMTDAESNQIRRGSYTLDENTNPYVGNKMSYSPPRDIKENRRSFQGKGASPKRKSEVEEEDINQSEAGPDIAHNLPDTTEGLSQSDMDYMAGGNSPHGIETINEALFTKTGTRRPVSAVLPQVKAVQENDSDAITMKTPPRSASEHSHLINFNTPTPNMKQLLGSDDKDSMMEKEYKDKLDKCSLIWQDRLLRVERDYQEIFNQKQEYEQEIAGLHKKLQSSEHNASKLKDVLGEYETTMIELISQKEKSQEKYKETIRCLQKQKDQAVDDLRQVESAFTSFNSKYERTKSIVEAQQKNEEILKTTVDDLKTKLKKQEQKYDLLKQHAEEKLAMASQEIETVRQSQDTELAKLRAMLKKCEMKIQSQEITIKQKENENSELSAICDELINKVGTK